MARLSTCFCFRAKNRVLYCVPTYIEQRRTSNRRQVSVPLFGCLYFFGHLYVRHGFARHRCKTKGKRRVAPPTLFLVTPLTSLRNSRISFSGYLKIRLGRCSPHPRFSALHNASSTSSHLPASVPPSASSSRRPVAAAAFSARRC